MTVELTIFSVIAVVFIIHTVLVHLLNWLFRKSNQGMFKEDSLAIAIVLNCLEFAFTFLIIKNILSQ
jgi:hypothetical protein